MHDDTCREQGFATQCSNYSHTLHSSTGLLSAGEGTQNTQRASYTSCPTPAPRLEELQVKMWSTAKCPAFQLIPSHTKWHHTASSTGLTAPPTVSTGLSARLLLGWLQFGWWNCLSLGIQQLYLNRNWCGEEKEKDRRSRWKSNTILDTPQPLIF